MVEVSRGTRRSCSRRRRRLLLRYEYTAETEVSSRFPFDRRVASPLPLSSSSHPSPGDLLPFDPPASPLVPRRVDSGLGIISTASRSGLTLDSRYTGFSYGALPHLLQGDDQLPHTDSSAPQPTSGSKLEPGSNFQGTYFVRVHGCDRHGTSPSPLLHCGASLCRFVVCLAGPKGCRCLSSIIAISPRSPHPPTILPPNPLVQSSSPAQANSSPPVPSGASFEQDPAWAAVRPPSRAISLACDSSRTDTDLSALAHARRTSPLPVGARSRSQSLAVHHHTHHPFPPSSLGRLAPPSPFSTQYIL